MIKKFFLFFILSFLGIPMILVSLGLFIPVYYTPLMIIRSVQNSINPAAVTTQKNISSHKIHHSWVSQDQISKHMKLAVIAAEDSKFFEHNGFDWEAIEKAIKYNETHKNKKGASTISQQTAKNLFLWPGRSWIRKGLETYFTFLIESIWSKQRILEVYLNITEFSPTVFGVQAASQVFFHKTALQINGSEAALLAAVLPNPKKFKVAGPSAYVQNRQSRILTRMQQQAFLDKMINTSKNNISKDDTNHSKNKSELINKPVSENVSPPTHNPANLLNEKNNSKIDTAPNIKIFVKDPESNNTDSDEDSLTPITDDEELENIEN